MERLQKLIADSGYCSRRKAEELIKKGKVLVNGNVITELGSRASFGDEVLVEGNLIEHQEKEYYLFYKPRGVVCTTKDDKGRKTVLDFFDDINKRIYPVGRLDYDTTGLLLLTNDGFFANLMTHPSNEIDKLYVAKVKGIVTKEDVKKIKSGVMIEGVKVYPSRVKVKKINKQNLTSVVFITIHDGKNHEVKKIFESVGHEVIKLKRESFGFLTLDGLKSGERRRLTSKEVKQLYNLANKKETNH